MASSETAEPSPRPQLPPNFATELWQRAAAQQKRKIDRQSFTTVLNSSTRILALFGAGLSAASGIPTFRGAGGFWREYDCMTLATPRAFSKDPALVWQFYSYRRHCALAAKPNRAHIALAELAKKKPDFLAISQNTRRATHPTTYKSVHGSLFSNKCTECSYVETDNFADPLVPAFALPPKVDIADSKFPLKDIPLKDLPRCPECTALLRPNVVDRVEDWMRGGNSGDLNVENGQIDLMLVVGTSALVHPAAGYIHAARARGARIAVFDMEEPTAASRLKKGDWFFKGDAAVLLPELLKEVIGVVPEV
ncbi:SIR2 family histone deacetylase [Mycena rebaudengoi]|nr:SIR2 family histone deacetylase [Mycena rebaudengoi]